MEEVVVTGEHEGPRLWKVRKGDHILWILGTVTPLPKKMIWQSDAVEAIVAQSQEVVPAWPAFGIGVNPFTALRVWMQWHSMQKIPDRMNLQEVLPPATYARFSALKARYAPKDSKLEELRPAFAAERLLDETLDANGLTFHNEVQHEVLKLARQHGVKVHQDKLKVQDPVDVLKDVGKAPLAGEVACLEAVIGRLETDIGPMQARARAWALGMSCGFRKLIHPDDRTACIVAVSTSIGCGSLSLGRRMIGFCRWRMRWRGIRLRWRCSRWIGCWGIRGRWRFCGRRGMRWRGPKGRPELDTDARIR